MVTTTTNVPVTLPGPAIVTSSQVKPSLQVTKAAPEGQGKKAPEKGKAITPMGKGKKNVTKMTTNAATTVGPSMNL